MAMTESPLDRARQALQISGTGAAPPAVIDRSKGDALLARARASVESKPQTRPDIPAEPPPVSAPAPAVSAPRAERVRLQMSCGATGRPFTALAERRNDELWLVAHELPGPGRGTGSAPERLSGSYRIGQAPAWACPHCGSREGTWTCMCTMMPDTLHCGGRRGRMQYCACGRLEERDLVLVETIEVRGQSMGAATRSGSSSPSRGNLPALYPKR